MTIMVTLTVSFVTIISTVIESTVESMIVGIKVTKKDMVYTVYLSYHYSQLVHTLPI